MDHRCSQQINQSTKDDDGKKIPIMKKNTVINRIRAVFTIASFSNKFERVNPAFVDKLMRQRLYLQDLEGVKELKSIKEELEGYVHISIARILQELNVDITRIGSALPALISAMAASEERSSILPTGRKGTSWKQG